jgi:endo-1,4-beta-xylanase
LTLKEAARKAGLHYGSSSDVTFPDAPPAYEQLFLKQCEFYAPIVSWKRLFPQQPMGTPVKVDPNIEVVLANGFTLTGYHLTWHQGVPPWFSDLTPDAAHKAVEEYVSRVSQWYAGRSFSWNVANEVLNPKEGRTDGLRHSPLLDKLGPNFVDFAARTAQNACPRVLRVLNEYGLEMDAPDDENKRRALIRMLDEFKKQGTPIDAIGLQAHLRLNEKKFTPKIYRDFLSEIASRGYKILITELDVFDDKTPPDIEVRDRMVAEMYRRYLDTALEEKAVISLVTWGLCDKYTWLVPGHGNKFFRSDNLPTRPLLYDDELRPKSSLQAVLAALHFAPKRKLAEI